MRLGSRIIETIAKVFIDQPCSKADPIVKGMRDDLDARGKEHSNRPEDTDSAMEETACNTVIRRSRRAPRVSLLSEYEAVFMTLQLVRPRIEQPTFLHSKDTHSCRSLLHAGPCESSPWCSHCQAVKVMRPAVAAVHRCSLIIG